MGTKQSKSSKSKKKMAASRAAKRRSSSPSTSSSPQRSLLSYSGQGSYLGMSSPKSGGIREGLGVECFGYGLDSGLAYAGEWKNDRWHGWGVCFVPASVLRSSSGSGGSGDGENGFFHGESSHDLDLDLPEWFVGKFKNGEVDGDAIQYDLFERERVQIQGEFCFLLCFYF
jgi:hypothetical protein